MAKIKHEQLPPHVVFVDTSILFHNDKKFPVNPKFDEFWNDYSAKISLKLKIPEVVKGEILYQQTSAALKELKKVNDAFNTISSITLKKYKPRTSGQKIKKEIIKKFDNWVHSKQAEVIETPLSLINWGKIIEDSLWRVPPFEKGTEKGFRDSIILETVVHYISHLQDEYQGAFICKDTLLRDATSQRLLADERFAVYENIEDFKSYLDLTHEQLENRFIKNIIKKASKKFFNKRDDNCLYYKENVKEQLKRYEKYFDNPEESEKKTGLLGGLLSDENVIEWSPIDTGTFWISNAQFVSREPSTNIYVWKNIVTYIRQYSTDSPSFNLETFERNVKILVLPFHITWQAKVSNDARFWSAKILTYELIDNDFRPPTSDDIKQWRLKT